MKFRSKLAVWPLLGQDFTKLPPLQPEMIARNFRAETFRAFAARKQGRDGPGPVLSGTTCSLGTEARYGVTEPRARPPTTRQEQPLPTNEGL